MEELSDFGVWVDVRFLLSRLGRVSTTQLWILAEMASAQRRAGVGRWFVLRRKALCDQYGISIRRYQSVVSAFRDAGLLVRGSGQCRFTLHPDLLTKRTSGRLEMMRKRFEQMRLAGKEKRDRIMRELEEELLLAGGDEEVVLRAARRIRWSWPEPVQVGRVAMQIETRDLALKPEEPVQKERRQRKVVLYRGR